MNLPTFIGAALVAIVFVAIVAREIYNKKHHKSSCGCSCQGCANSSACHMGK